MQHLLNENIEALRARAERFRRLAKDLLDPRSSEEAVSIAEELDAEIARLLTAPQTSITARCH